MAKSMAWGYWPRCAGGSSGQGVERRVLYLGQTPPSSTGGGGRGPRRHAIDGLGAAGLVAVEG